MKCYLRMFYNIPPPSINRNKPKNIATIQMMMPPLDLPMMDKSRPTIASGMLNQFNQPNKGIIPKNIPMSAKMPKSLPRSCII